MIDPLNQCVVVRDFQDHINAGGNSAVYPGIDYESKIGTPCIAVEDGMIIEGNDHQGGNQGGANYIVLLGSKGWWFYVHLDRFNGGNRAVKQGDIIGYTGDTGRVTGPHLHFGLKRNNRYVNPQSYLLNNQNMSNLETQEVNDLNKMAGDFFNATSQIFQMNDKLAHLLDLFTQSIAAQNAQTAALNELITLAKLEQAAEQKEATIPTVQPA